jgi:glycosyltransferase involved in cell wall biosynthesis
MPNVTVMCPHVGPEWNHHPNLPTKLREWTAEAIRRMNENTDGQFDRPLLWYYSPMDSAWSLGHFENRGVVYDCMDELSQFTGAPPQLIENEKRLMRHADVVFTGGFEMGEKRKKLHHNVHIFGCGVEIEHFGKARDPEAPIPADIDFMARPILGWFGVVDERVDYGMVGEVARKRPDWSFAMVGPVVKVDPNLLPHAPNLYWMGGRDYQQLPNYCAAFDLCMMPFAMNASTQYINPTKGLEYMAAGRPIISTPVKDVVQQWSDIVSIVRTADEFIEAADRFFTNELFRMEKVAKGLALAGQCGWENTVRSMQQLIRDAINDPHRHSAGKIEPLTNAQLQYVFQGTQGS